MLPIEAGAVRLPRVSRHLVRILQKECQLVVWQGYVHMHQAIFHWTLHQPTTLLSK